MSLIKLIKNLFGQIRYGNRWDNIGCKKLDLSEKEMDVFKTLKKNKMDVSDYKTLLHYNSLRGENDPCLYIANSRHKDGVVITQAGKTALSLNARVESFDTQEEKDAFIKEVVSPYRFLLQTKPSERKLSELLDSFFTEREYEGNIKEYVCDQEGILGFVRDVDEYLGIAEGIVEGTEDMLEAELKSRCLDSNIEADEYLDRFNDKLSSFAIDLYMAVKKGERPDYMRVSDAVRKAVAKEYAKESLLSGFSDAVSSIDREMGFVYKAFGEEVVRIYDILEKKKKKIDLLNPPVGIQYESFGYESAGRQNYPDAELVFEDVSEPEPERAGFDLEEYRKFEALKDHFGRSLMTGCINSVDTTTTIMMYEVANFYKRNPDLFSASKDMIEFTKDTISRMMEKEKITTDDAKICYAATMTAIGYSRMKQLSDDIKEEINCFSEHIEEEDGDMGLKLYVEAVKEKLFNKDYDPHIDEQEICFIENNMLDFAYKIVEYNLEHAIDGEGYTPRTGFIKKALFDAQNVEVSSDIGKLMSPKECMYMHASQYPGW